MEKKLKKVSIVIPVFNGEAYIKETIASICRQTYKELEIIIINDNSNDGTLQIINTAAEADTRIQVYNNEIKKGAGGSRNIGIDHLSGDYTIFLDADDIYEENMIERMVLMAEKYDLDVTICQCDYLYKLGKIKIYAPYAYSINDRQFIDNSVCRVEDLENVFTAFSGWPWDKLIRTDLFMKNGIRFQQITSSNDLSFIFSCLASAEKIGVEKSILVHHVKQKGTISATRGKNWDCFCMALLDLREYLKNHGMFERFEQGYVNYALHFSLWNYYSIDEPVRSQILKELKEKWFDEFGICERSDEYFFNKAEYRQFLRMNSGKRNRIPTYYRYTHKAAERIRKTGFWHFIYELLKDTGKYMLLNFKMLFIK